MLHRKRLVWKHFLLINEARTLSQMARRHAFRSSSSPESGSGRACWRNRTQALSCCINRHSAVPSSHWTDAIERAHARIAILVRPAMGTARIRRPLAAVVGVMHRLHRVHDLTSSRERRKHGRLLAYTRHVRRSLQEVAIGKALGPLGVHSVRTHRRVRQMFDKDRSMHALASATAHAANTTEGTLSNVNAILRQCWHRGCAVGGLQFGLMSTQSLCCIAEREAAY